MDDEKIKTLFSKAETREEKRRFFDFSEWSQGCKDYLVNIDGPYNAKDSSEIQYKKILTLSPQNEKAKDALARLEKNRTLSFSGCDDYKVEIEDAPEVDALFD